MFKGVKEYKAGNGWYAYTQMEGVQTVIYTADTAQECASAYNEYLKVMKPKHWERNTNKVDRCHDFDKLWIAVELVGSPIPTKVANALQKKLQELLKQDKES